jgi:hypothetical protein
MLKMNPGHFSRAAMCLRHADSKYDVLLLVAIKRRQSFKERVETDGSSHMMTMSPGERTNGEHVTSSDVYSAIGSRKWMTSKCERIHYWVARFRSLK